MKKLLVSIILLIACDAIFPDVSTGAQVTIAPVIIAGIVSAIASMKASEDAKKAAAMEASGAAAGGEGGGIQMEGTLPPPEPAEGSKINEALLKADGQAPPASIALPSVQPGTGPLPQGAPVITAGSTGNFAPVPGQQSQTDIGVQLPESSEIPPPQATEGMSLEAKMAIAAQLGSLARGPGPIPAPHVGAGPGINMQPVFLKDLRG